MNRLLSLFLLLIMLLQVLPVAQWLGDEPTIGLFTGEEEHKGDSCDQGKESKQDTKALFDPLRLPSPFVSGSQSYAKAGMLVPPSPHLDLLVPPPNAFA